MLAEVVGINDGIGVFTIRHLVAAPTVARKHQTKAFCKEVLLKGKVQYD
jgi:hypothetical protein